MLAPLIWTWSWPCSYAPHMPLLSLLIIMCLILFKTHSLLFLFRFLFGSVPMPDTNDGSTTDVTYWKTRHANCRMWQLRNLCHLYVYIYLAYRLNGSVRKDQTNTPYASIYNHSRWIIVTPPDAYIYRNVSLCDLQTCS